MNRFWLGLLMAGICAAPAFAQMGEAEGDEFSTCDTNSDGKITTDEIKALWKDGSGSIEIYMFAIADSDDDGTLTKKEWTDYAAKAANGEVVKPSAKDVDFIADNTWEFKLKMYDKNSDGVIKKEELSKEEQEGFGELDLDNDSTITKDELKKYIRKQWQMEEPKDGPKEGPKDGPKDGPKAGDGELKKELFTLYTKEGRSWTIKSTMKMEGMDPMVTYMKTEVLKVGDDYAEIQTTMLDKDKKPMMGMEPTKTKISFRVPKATGDAPKDPPKVETKEETIKVEAGEFECIVTTSEAGGQKSTVWTSKKHPGLMVKMEAGSMTSELVEFKD